MNTTEQIPTTSKHIEQVNFNYGKDFIIETINGAQVLRKCITDVYNTALPEVELTVGKKGFRDTKTTINFQDECAKQLANIPIDIAVRLCHPALDFFRNDESSLSSTYEITAFL